MFGIGFTELIVILLLLVLVVGPEQLPDVARKAILFVKAARRQMAEIRAEVDRQTEPLRQPLEEAVRLAEQGEADQEQPSAKTDDEKPAAGPRP